MPTSGSPTNLLHGGRPPSFPYLKKRFPTRPGKKPIINHTSEACKTMGCIVRSQKQKYFLNHQSYKFHHGFNKLKSCGSGQSEFLNDFALSCDNWWPTFFVEGLRTHAKCQSGFQSSILSGSLIRHSLGCTRIWPPGSKVGNHLLFLRTITSNVIQRSLLGPLLLVMRFDGIFTSVGHHTLLLFEDDMESF